MLEDIKDSFSAGAVDTALWDQNPDTPSAVVVVEEGRAIFQKTAVSGGMFRLRSKIKYDCTNSKLSAKITPTTLPPGVQAVVAQFTMSVLGKAGEYPWETEGVVVTVSSPPSGGEWINMTRGIYNGSITPYYINVAYNRTTHKYIRMRFASTLVHLETSTDGKVWTNHGSMQHLMTDMQAKANFEYFNGQGDPAYLDDVNLAPSSGAFLAFF